MKKITKKQYYEEIISIMQGGEYTVNYDEVIAFCQNEIAALERKAQKSKERADKKKQEVDELGELVLNSLSSDLMTAADVAAAVAEVAPNEEYTIGKVTARLTKLVNAGKVHKEQITVKSTIDDKKTRKMAYCLLCD